MGNSTEDTLVSFQDLINKYKDLKILDKYNQILSVAKLHDDEGGMTFSEEYSNKYQKNHPKKIHGYWNYIDAIQGEIDKIGIMNKKSMDLLKDMQCCHMKYDSDHEIIEKSRLPKSI